MNRTQKTALIFTVTRTVMSRLIRSRWRIAGERFSGTTTVARQPCAEPKNNCATSSKWPTMRNSPTTNCGPSWGNPTFTLPTSRAWIDERTPRRLGGNSTISALLRSVAQKPKHATAGGRGAVHRLPGEAPSPKGLCFHRPPAGLAPLSPRKMKSPGANRGCGIMH